MRTLLFLLFAVIAQIVHIKCTPSPNIMTNINIIEDNCDYLEHGEINQLKQNATDLTVLQLNIRGLLGKQELLKQFLLEFNDPPDILLLCETWLKPNTDYKVNLLGYKCYHTHRKDKIGGGVSILVKEKLRSRHRPDLLIQTDIFEYQVVELKTNKQNVLAVSGYRPPNTNSDRSLKEYKDILKKLRSQKTHDLIIGLDHNYDLLKCETNKSTTKFMNMNEDYNLICGITKPTRVTNKSATLLDNIIIGGKLQCNYTPYVIVEDMSDHYPCLVILHNVNLSKKDKVSITKRNITDDSIDTIKRKLDSVDWMYLEDLDVNEAFESFHEKLTNTIDEVCPQKEFRIRQDKLIRDPWITKGLQNSLRRQKHLYKEQLRSNDPVSTNRYKSYRNLLKKLLRQSKIAYFTAKCIEYKQNSKKLWQLINQIINKGQKKTLIIENLKIGNLLRYSPQEITKGFCDHFASVGERYAKNIGPSDVLVETYIDQITSNKDCMFLHPTDRQEINSLIQLLPSKTSSGFDDISNKLLKQLSPSLLTPLCLIYNSSLNTGIFPELMKRADVSPLFKSKLHCDTNNYRPISLLLTISKILEKLVYKRTYSFLEKTNQLYKSQYGFRSHHSCENAVSELTSEVIKGFQNGFYTAALFLDLSKAFNTLEHEVLLKKLEKYGIRGIGLSWFKSYLCDRKMRVKCHVASSGKMEYSDYQTVNYGTPQGSCLGPLIFLIFTNDLYKHLNHCSSILFADDTTLYKTHRNLNFLKWSIQDDMNTLIDWFKANKLTLNVEKTICILFQPTGSNKEFDIEINGVKIFSSNITKFLGMWLDHHMTWATHIGKLTAKLKRNTKLLEYGQHFMTKECKKMIYFAHIQSHINYGLLLWGNSLSNDQVDKLVKIQLNCIQFIEKKTTMTDHKILRVDQLIDLENSKFGYKLVHGLLPTKIEEACLFDSNKRYLKKTHTYGTRNKSVPNVPNNMNKQYRASFLNKGPQSLLNKEYKIKSKPTLKTFISALKTSLLTTY